MICYLDSSVLLRKLFREENMLKEWPQIEQAFSSRLTSLECRRTMDRMRIINNIAPEKFATRLQWLEELLDSLGIIPLAEPIIKRAEDAFLTPVRSLDAIHLATALLWKEEQKTHFYFATHDQQLATAAKAHGFSVIGI